MIANPIELLKEQYTDKYVVVNAERPELARFRDVVGQVKTVNMSGRALVEFDDYHLNIGWYDIDPAFLKVVDKPPPKPKEPPAKKPAAKPAAGEATSAAGKAAAKPAAAAKPQAKASPGGKMSVAEMLAAARGGTTPAKPQAAAEKPKPQTPSAPKASAPAAKMTVEQMLAAARAGATAPKPEAKAAPAEAPAEEPAADEPAGEPASAGGEPEPPPAAEKPPSGKVDRSTMSVADMIAWCREHDAK